MLPINHHNKDSNQANTYGLTATFNDPSRYKFEPGARVIAGTVCSDQHQPISIMMNDPSRSQLFTRALAESN